MQFLTIHRAKIAAVLAVVAGVLVQVASAANHWDGTGTGAVQLVIAAVGAFYLHGNSRFEVASLLKLPTPPAPTEAPVVPAGAPEPPK